MATLILAPTIMTRLRTETREQHDATEAIPFSAAIVAGSLPLASYAPKPHWVALSARMNELDLTDAEADAVVEAARETFDRIGGILVSIGLSEPLGSAA